MIPRNSSFQKRDLSVLGLSIFVHLLALAAMTLVTIAGTVHAPLEAIESILTDEMRTPEEFTSELNTDREIAESMNVAAGGAVVTGTVGAGGAGGTGGGGGGGGGLAVDHAKIDNSAGFRDPTVGLGTGELALPGLESLGNDLGAGQIAGEVGAVVDGYGAALDRLTQELVRLMRESKVLVVWLFDESESMKDDQEDLKERIHRVYEELRLFDEDAKADVLLSAVVSFGQDVHFMLPKKKPTDDVPRIMKAIDAIPIDKTGVENTCHAISTVIADYRRQAAQGKRKLVVVVISDEAGDDGEKVEETLQQARTARAPIYFLGRESVFGNLYAYVRWVHPQTGGLHYLPIRRGPETPFAELLPFDGFRRRMDASLSGFGPYEQVRLCRDTGGIFFMLPSEEQNINDPDSRKYASLDMKEYTPDIATRRDYVERRDKSPFRRAIWEAIVLLNPYDEKNKEMEIPIDNWYSVEPGEYALPVTDALGRCRNLFALLTEAEQRLKAVQDLRKQEKSRRWRADYDLMLGQVLAYRVRLFQYSIALEQFARSIPTRKFADKKSNQWAVGISAKDLLKPDEQQLRATKVSVDDLERARKAALKQFAAVQEEHPGTPWAARAAWELSRGFGMTFLERYIPPPRPSTTPAPTTPIAPLPKL
jgi:hypothetical protein